MIDSFLVFASLLFAQEPPADEGFGALLRSPLLPMVAVLVLMWIFLFLPEQRRRKKQQEMLMTSLKKNDKVLTQSGIIGIVLNINDKEDEVTLKLDEGKMKILRSSIIKIFNGQDSEANVSAAATAIKKK